MTLSEAPSAAYNLNQDQMKAAEAFLQFLFSPDKEFIITGPAGVGKTYLMNYIVDNTMPRYLEMCKLIGVTPEFDEVHMTATTNKAADVLSQAVKRPTSTVHSFFNLTVWDDFATGISKLKQTRNWMIHQKKIIFIDESSMIDTPLWNMLHDGTANCKLVYVGDKNQLAPVMEDLSPVYKHNTQMVELLKPVRNAGQPALMEICEQLRKTVSTLEFTPIKTVPGVIDLLDSQQMQAEILREFQQQTHSARILAYTNKQVIAYNDHIRGIRLLPATVQTGELLIMNSVFHSGRGHVPVETEVEVLKNRPGQKLLIDPNNDVSLDVDYLDLRLSLGADLEMVPFATNKPHLDSLIKYYAKNKQWDLYYKLKNDIADLRPRDAATVHKSQGSTYENVFIDLGNISSCNNPNQVARMLYVAFSRARSRVFLYGNLIDKYGGIILP